MAYISQFPELLEIARRDGEGGLAAEPPSIIKGESIAMTLSFAADTEYGNWTGGAFDAVLRAAPGAGGDPLATYTCVTGTPSGGVTPVTLTLLGTAQGGIPAPPAGDGIGEVFLAVGFTPTGGTRKTLVTTRQLVRGGI